MSNNIRFSYRLFNPVFWHFRAAMRDVNIRNIWAQGGSSSGKSVSISQAVLLNALQGNGSAIIFRKVGASIKNTIYEEFKIQCEQLQIKKYFKFTKNHIECISSECKIDFSGVDDPEKIKGITSYRWVILEEVSEFDYEDYKQMTLRLRGKEGLQIIGLFNPISDQHWIKVNIFDNEEWENLSCFLPNSVKNVKTGAFMGDEYSMIAAKKINKAKSILNPVTCKYETHSPDSLILKTTYKNNFWIVGSPNGQYGFYDKQTIANYELYRLNDRSYYDVYALGEWGTVRQGNEFLHAFNKSSHTSNVELLPDLPIHISIDNNIYPYISVSLFQVDRTYLRQFKELCFVDPQNTATAAGDGVREYLKEICYSDIICVHGDASTRSGNTIDDEKRSFLDKFIERIEEEYIVNDVIPASNPSVSLSGEFLNSILSNSIGLSLIIDDQCLKSINDYESVKKDVNGNILKLRTKDRQTGISYEKNGHLTDCLRYIVCDVFDKEYKKFSNKRKRNSIKGEDELQYFNSKANIEYSKRVIFICLLPNSHCIAIEAGFIDNYIDILRVMFTDSYASQLINEFVGESKFVIFECAKQYISEVYRLRECGNEVIGRSAFEHKKIVDRIQANELFIKSNIRIMDNYAEYDEYDKFVENMLDYDYSKNYEAMNMLSIVSHYAIMSSHN